MLGWHVSIFRQTNDGASPAMADSSEGARVAVWQTGIGGLDWIKELIDAGTAISLGGDGYPYRFTMTAAHVIPQITEAPPGARDAWLLGASDIVTDKWEGETTVDHAAVAACRPDEWLLVEAWDES